MKKLLIATVAAAVAATGFAGSYATPAAKPAPTANSYVDLAVGYAITNYDRFNNTAATTGLKHANGGFAGGIDAGYTFMPHLGAEVGFMMPFQKATSGKYKASQYSLYAAGRIAANVGEGFNVYLLGGLGYTSTNDKIAGKGSDSKSSAIGFLGGFGADYAVADGFTVGAKYLRFAGRNKAEAKSTTFAGPQYLLVTVGYQISM